MNRHDFVSEYCQSSHIKTKCPLSRSARLIVDDFTTLHQFTESYRIRTSNTNPCVTMLICKYCRIMHRFPMFTAVMAPKSHNNVFLWTAGKQKSPPGMLRGQIRKEMKSQKEFLKIFLFDGTFPRVVALLMIRSLLASFLSVLLQSLLSALP